MPLLISQRTNSICAKILSVTNCLHFCRLLISREMLLAYEGPLCATSRRSGCFHRISLDTVQAVFTESAWTRSPPPIWACSRDRISKELLASHCPPQCFRPRAEQERSNRSLCRDPGASARLPCLAPGSADARCIDRAQIRAPSGKSDSGRPRAGAPVTSCAPWLVTGRLPQWCPQSFART